MQGAITRKHWFVLATASVLASYYCYFRTPLAVNANGADPAVWPYLIDVLFSVPLLYFILFRPGRKQMLTAWLGIASLGMLAGRWINPAQEHAYGQYSLLLIAIEVGLELLLVGVLIQQCRQQLQHHADADDAMARIFTSKPMLFEARIWYYALFLRDGNRLRFRGEQHFRYDQNHGNASNQFAWIMVMLFEMPISHFLLHLWLGNSWQAWTIDLLNLWGLLYFLAEYRATRWRPISLDHDALLIRTGVLAPDRMVPLPMIASVSRCEDGIRRQRGVIRCRQSGSLNVRITLQADSQLPDMFGRNRPVSDIYLSLDTPAVFVDTLRARLASSGLNPSTPSHIGQS